MSDNEFGPVDLTRLKPDKLPRLIDIPGVKELIEAAYRAGFDEGYNHPVIADYSYIYRDNYACEYMKALEAKDENDNQE